MDTNGRPPVRPDTRRRLLAALLVTAATVLVRLPFLRHGGAFFTSDEAVEGLMARHVLHGEFPVFLWGQSYKGVPEVYLNAALFALIRPSVIALKTTTLALFAAYAGLQFVLLDTLFTPAIAWLASAFLLATPPAFVLWTLNGSAEVVLTLLAGALLLLGVARWKATGSRSALTLAAAATGFGLWVQQYIVFYLAALAVCAGAEAVRRPGWLRDMVAARDASRWSRRAADALLAVGLAYGALGAWAFLTGGFTMSVGHLAIGVHDAQKLWRLGAVALLAWAGARWVQRWPAGHRAERARTLAAPALAFLAGYSPALGHAIFAGGRAPIGHASLAALVASSSTIVGDIVPIVFGFRSPTTARLPIPWEGALVIVVVLAASYLAIRRRCGPRVFHVFLLCTPVLFLLSGAFVDVQSYRYLMLLYAALPAVYAVGVRAVMTRWRLAGAALGVALVALGAAQQVAWYRQLAPDNQSQRLLACLQAGHIRFAYADYWLSYKLTFLSGEQIIVAPINGVDRYPPYRRAVDASGAAPTVVPPPPGASGCDGILAPGPSR